MPKVDDEMKKKIIIMKTTAKTETNQQLNIRYPFCAWNNIRKAIIEGMLNATLKFYTHIFILHITHISSFIHQRTKNHMWNVTLANNKNMIKTHHLRPAQQMQKRKEIKKKGIVWNECIFIICFLLESWSIWKTRSFFTSMRIAYIVHRR